MNLYKYHDKPEDLHRHKDADKDIAKVFWKKYSEDRDALKQRENAIAKDTDAAYYYAVDVLKAPWPKGEPAIAKDAESAFHYARIILKSPWPKGEPAIAKDSEIAKEYTNWFPEREEALNKLSKS